MSNTSARIGLPYIMAAQAQKHLTHNEALQRLDAVTQLVVEETDAVTPPALAALGDVYALGAAPSGDWTGQAGQLAYRADSGWIFVTPLDGWQAWDRAAGVVCVFQGGSGVRWEQICKTWQVLASGQLRIRSIGCLWQRTLHC